jgi:hypothetical protein
MLLGTGASKCLFVMKALPSMPKPMNQHQPNIKDFRCTNVLWQSLRSTLHKIQCKACTFAYDIRIQCNAQQQLKALNSQYIKPEHLHSIIRTK